MIIGFERETHELTPYEEEKILPLVVSGLSKRIGKSKAITNAEMVERLKAHGYKASGPRIRKVIHHIRITGAVKCLMATSKGYYVSNDRKELQDYVDSLHQRADSILQIAKQIDFQIKHL